MKLLKIKIAWLKDIVLVLQDVIIVLSDKAEIKGTASSKLKTPMLNTMN